jgi:hypothetical protein
MTPEETSFATQRPLSVVAEYVKMIEEFGLDEQRVYDRVDGRVSLGDDHIEPAVDSNAGQNERREQEPMTG